MNPLLTHPLVAAADTAILAIAAHYGLPLLGLSIPYTAIIAAIVVSAVYFGREADQREHELKNYKGWSPIGAFLVGKYLLGLSAESIAQWLVAAAGALAAGVGLYLLGL